MSANDQSRHLVSSYHAEPSVNVVNIGNSQYSMSLHAYYSVKILRNICLITNLLITGNAGVTPIYLMASIS